MRTFGLAVLRDRLLGSTCCAVVLGRDERRRRVLVHPVSKIDRLGGVTGFADEVE